jgi:hypothetical protein
MSTFHLTTTDYDDGTSYAIQQGATFDRVAFYFDEDLTGWTARGQVRDNYADLGGVIQASFSFAALVYAVDTVNGVTKSYTKVKPILSATQTQALLFSLKLRADSSVKPVPGKNVWVYDIELVSPEGIVRRDIEGWVEVTKEVTRNA